MVSSISGEDVASITNVDSAQKENDLIRRLFSQFPGRRRLFAAGIALTTALISALMSVGGATPAAAAAGTHPVTVWVPLACEISVTLPTGATFLAPSEVGVAVNATIPDSVNPGEVFSLTNSWTVQTFPPAAQAAANLFTANAIEGIVSDFENQVTNATTAFTGPGVGTATQINQVAALQPPGNADAPSPTDPLINGPSPLQAYVEHPPAPTGVFSFGPIPSDGTGASGNAYGPAPGTGGGFTPTSGTADPIATFGPFTTTGPAGSNIVLTVGDPTHPFDFNGTPLNFAAATTLFFQNKNTNAWQGPVPVNCGVDTTSGALASPDTSYLAAFTIPIVAPGGVVVSPSPSPTPVVTPVVVPVTPALPKAGSPGSPGAGSPVGLLLGIAALLLAPLAVTLARRRHPDDNPVA